MERLGGSGDLSGFIVDLWGEMQFSVMQCCKCVRAAEVEDGGFFKPEGQ